MLKKLLKILIIILFISINVFAEENKDYMLKTYDKVPDVYVTKINSEHQIFDYMYIITRKSDKQFIYCIEPGIHIKDDFEYTGAINGYEDSNLTKSQYERIKLLSYYGYGYKDLKKGIDHTDKKWYAATQGLIWEIESNDYEIYFTNYLQGPKVDKYTSEYKEIKELANNYNKLPSFSNQKKDIYLGGTITLVDNNYVLSDFEISKSNDNIKITTKENTLQIEALKTGNTTITLTKYFNFYNSKPLVYTSPTSQNLFSVGNLEPITTKFTVNILGGKVTINKVDSENRAPTTQGDASLINAVYGLYDMDDNLITKLTTDKEKRAESDNNLYLNKEYYIKEIMPSIGYEIDKEKHFFILDENNQIINLTLKENIIKRKVDIYKVYGSGETKILTPESNVKFDIYLKSQNEYYSSIITNEDGYASITLPYGSWIFKQQTTSENYAKVEDFEIIIDEPSSVPITKVLSDNKLSARVKVIKIDSKTKELIPLNGIKFKIRNTDTNEYICQTIAYPIKNNLCEYETDKGIIITPLPLEIGNYELIEVDNQQINGYYLNKDPLKFSINNSSSLYYDEDLGSILELKFLNDPIVELKETTDIKENSETIMVSAPETLKNNYEISLLLPLNLILIAIKLIYRKHLNV